MKKQMRSIVIMTILIFIAFEILTESNSILNSVLFSFTIWQKNIFPSLFPYFVLSELLIHFGFIPFASELLKPFMQIFKIKSEAAFVLIMGLVSGFPSSAKYTRELYLKGILNEEEASKVLTFTHFSNPLFLLGTVSISFLGNKASGIFVLIIHYFTNFIVGFLFRNYYPSKKTEKKVSFKNAIREMSNFNKDKTSFGTILTNAIQNSIHTLLLILGTVTCFLVITTIIDNNVHLNNFNQSILNGFVEMTQGLRYISLLEIPLKLKSTLSIMILSFGGLSVHMQIISILSDTKIKYLPFLTARILHATIGGIIGFSFFDIWMKFYM